MTDKEIFNIVKNHLLNQKEASFDPTVGCMLRSPDGRKCALGCLIKDEHYSEDLEEYSAVYDDFIDEKIEESIVKSLGIESPLRESTIKMIARLQNIHDEYVSESWDYALLRMEDFFRGDEYVVIWWADD